AGTTTSAKTARRVASLARRSRRSCPPRATTRAWARAVPRRSRSWWPASRPSKTTKKKKNRPAVRGSPRRPNPEGDPHTDIPRRRADLLGPTARRVRRLGPLQGGGRHAIPLRLGRLGAHHQL